MSDEVFEIEYRSTGGEEATAEARSLRQATTEVASANQRLESVTAASSRGTRAMAQEFGGATQSVLGVGRSLGQTIPAFGTFSDAIGSVASGITSMSAGMGPAGLAIAGITIVLSAVSAAMDDTVSEAARLATAFDRELRSVQRLEEGLRNLAQAQSQRRASEFERFQQDDADREDRARAEIQAAETMIETTNRLFQRGLLDSEQYAERVAMIRAQQAEAQAELAFANRLGGSAGTRAEEEERLQDELQDEISSARRPRGGGGNSNADALREEEAAWRSLLGAIVTYTDPVIEQREVELELWNEMYGTEAIAGAEARAAGFAQNRLRDTQSQIDSGRELEEQRTRMEEQLQSDLQGEIRAAQEHAQEQEELAQITNDAWTEVGGSVKQFLGDAFRYIAQGNAATGEGFLRLLDSFLESTAIEYTIKAIAETGNAIAAFARNDYKSGPQHLAAAGIYGAVAALAGAAGAVINVPSESQAAATGQVEPASGSQGAGGGNVYLYAPQAVWTERERAEIIASSFREARRDGGPSAARF